MAGALPRMEGGMAELFSGAWGATGSRRGTRSRGMARIGYAETLQTSLSRAKIAHVKSQVQAGGDVCDGELQSRW